MPLHVRRWDLPISTRELGLTRDAYTKSILRDWLRLNMTVTLQSLMASPPDLQTVVDDFAEYRTEGAVDSLRAYFNQAPTSGFTPGGRRASHVALVYPRRQLLPPVQHIGVVGEGIAGYYLETFEDLTLMVRPFGLTPDMVLRERSGRRLALAEVKTSLQPGRRVFPTPVAIQLLELLAKVKFMRTSRYLAFVVNVSILGLDEYHLDVLRMAEV